MNAATATDDRMGQAPGAPGIAPTWCSSAKSMVGTAPGATRLWYTVGGGIINEVYWPRVDLPQIRDLGFIVADGKGFWVEVKRLWSHELRAPAPGVPAVDIHHHHDRFSLRLRIAPDTERDALLVEVTLEGDTDLRPYVLLAPRLGATGHQNRASVVDHLGHRFIGAEQGPFALALAAVDESQRDAFGRVSVGYVGTSDGWQDFARHGAMRWTYRTAGPGNVAALGELERRCVVGLAFSTSVHAAGTLVRSALAAPFDAAWQAQIEDWSGWHRGCGRFCQVDTTLPDAVRQQFFTSAMVLRAHRDRSFPGAMVASLSIPWGNTRDDRGGYHLIWPRDLVSCAGALLALGAWEEARDTLRYLIATQLDDGHWYQNQWLGGHPYWHGVQLDEVAFPVLLAAALAEREALDGISVTHMVRRALGFLARNGPVTEQDRWEENAGLNTFTLAACIGALVAGARFLDEPDRRFALALADDWNARLEDWTTAGGGALARRFGVEAYYVRVAPPEAIGDRGALERPVPVRNQDHDLRLNASELVACDFLQLVRFGIRRADDPLILATLEVVDGLLRTDTPRGPVWHRYNHDGYGEHADGGAFDGTGIGRGWPLLSGERGHYELTAGRDPLPYLEVMAAMAGDGGMLPEQVWDSAPIPERGLQPGHPTGSAMPLAWAHAEFVKLVASRALGRPFDRPEALWERYGGRRPEPATAVWTPKSPVTTLRTGQRLTIGLPAPARVHHGTDGWQNAADTSPTATALGLHWVELDTSALPPGARIDFTWQTLAEGRWSGENHQLRVVDATVPSPHQGG